MYIIYIHLFVCVCVQFMLVSGLIRVIIITLNLLFYMFFIIITFLLNAWVSNSAIIVLFCQVMSTCCGAVCCGEDFWIIIKRKDV